LPHEEELLDDDELLEPEDLDPAFTHHLFESTIQTLTSTILSPSQTFAHHGHQLPKLNSLEELFDELEEELKTDDKSMVVVDASSSESDVSKTADLMLLS